jgi:hypothetical protein
MNNNIGIKIIDELNKIHFSLVELTKSIKHLPPIEVRQDNFFFSPAFASLLGALLAGLITWFITTKQIERNESLHQKRDFFAMLTNLMYYLPLPDKLSEYSGYNIGIDEEMYNYIDRAFLELESYHYDNPKLSDFINKYVSPLHKYIEINFFRQQYIHGHVFYEMKPKEVKKQNMLSHFTNPQLKSFIEEKYKGVDIVPPSIIDVLPAEPRSESPFVQEVKKYMVNENVTTYKGLYSLLLQEHNIILKR